MPARSRPARPLAVRRHRRRSTRGAARDRWVTRVDRCRVSPWPRCGPRR
jgi:hypothetical protein